ncbi:MAG: ABC transporter ATP-binding protein, partial [Acutalibacteraceae bacterium]|nr:ABC transporter ATP-binding protein [Acutalibacteraceae bacterium]
MIEAINLTKRFENKIALDSVNFEIKEGSVYGLVGSNGSGKSTLMRLISGVYTSDGGDILIDGEKPFNNPQLKSKICYLPDTPYFIHQSNINEMAKYYAMLYPTFDWERFEYLSSIFPLNKKARIATMSKGMQRQAALMLCLSVRPKYLLLDEAFDGLDPVMRKVLKSLLAEGVSDGMTAIIASHNLSDLESLCDSVGLLHNGNIVFNEDIDNLKGNVHKVQAVFSMIPDLSVFDELKPMKIEKTGSLIQLVVRGDEKEIKSFLNTLVPVFIELVPPSLEEIF